MAKRSGLTVGALHPLAQAAQRNQHLDRFLLHLRQRLTQRKLNLVLGAGATKDAGAPLWGTLVSRLRDKLKAAAVRGNNRPEANERFGPAMAAQILLTRLERKIESSGILTKQGVPPKRSSDFVNHSWIEQIRNAIYKDVPIGDDEKFAQHPYLEPLAALVSSCPLTINFNFDDIVDRATQLHCQRQNKDQPSIVWKLPVAYLDKGCTILHINGYLPRAGKAASERLVLTEGAFSELMLQQTDYQSLTLLRSFSESTVLIVGCSLEDSSLKAMLKAASHINPGNYHYLIHYISDDDRTPPEQLAEIFDANRRVYNLITIFLRSEEIKLIMHALSEANDGKFSQTLKEMNPNASTHYRFYVVGAVGAGKTTLLRNLRMFQTHEEWSGPVPDDMYKDSAGLSDQQKIAVDTFLKAQLYTKNQTMAQAAPGFHIMDRGYLDLIAFSDEDAENVRKVDMLESHVSSGHSLQNGQIILLIAEEDELEKSQWGRGRIPKSYGGDGYSKDTLVRQQTILQAIYAPHWQYNARSFAAGELARLVAFDVLTKPCVPLDFRERITFVRNKGVAEHYDKPGRKGRGK
jgi:energy-coupling factor transporter ATP-binding protein EcfA2